MKAGVMILLLAGCTRRTEIHMDGLRKESFSETEQERQTEEQTGVSSVIYVYVCGAVQAPGVYALQDGQRLYVYTQEEVQARAADASQTTGGEPGGDAAYGRVDLNTASKELLMTLPGIGEARAEAILAYRSEHGRFRSIEEIQNISGIKSSLFEKIREKIMVS